ncbi:MAG: autotransporter outer membrane beta-barrel domain-containing protein [Pseudomonadota bacterium]
MKLSRLIACLLLLLVGINTATAQSLEEIEDSISADLESFGVTPPQDALGFVVGQICPSGAISPGMGKIVNDDLQARCGEIVGATGSGNNDARDGLQAMAPEEDAVIASSQVDAGSAQVDNIGDRLSSLRAGTAGAGLAYQQNSGFNWSGGAAGDGASRWGFFVNGLYASSDRDTTVRESGFEADDFGFTAGIDFAMNERLVVGAAFGYRNSDAEIDNNGGNMDTDSDSFFGYFSYYPSEFWYVDAMLGYTDNDHEQNRTVAYSIFGPGTGLAAPVTVSNAALSETESDELSFSFTVGHIIQLSTFHVDPFVRFDYADIDIDGFTERMRDSAAGTPGSGLALIIDEQEFESVTIALGTDIGTEWQWGTTTVYPVFTAEYVHEFENENAPIVGRFVNDSSNTRFSLPTDEPDENFFNVGFSLSALLSDQVVGYARYQGLLDYDNLDVHAFEFGIKANF